MPASTETKMSWILGVQVGGTIAGGIVMMILRLHGIRFFFEFIPTFVLAWIPLLAGSAALAAVSKASRKAWLLWIASLVIMILTTAYAAVGETPSAVIPMH